ncbi:uncharacterized protein LOC109802623 [Cajanus cajan]|uniref:uncharacterized protein LOC109802623 n=1 Tax=Cajanus cajan TaxID=3821 RepID=UPI00098D961A|nr:uncharacterized protein LOC109802623 [Cajanus cajan]
MNWLTEIEKIFNVIECPLAQKDNFKRVFLEKYFPDDVRSQKEVEFLELKQGNNTIAEYAAKFDSLVRYCSHYHGEGGERAKVNKCRIFDRDNHARAAFYKGAEGPMRAVSSDASIRSKPYFAPARSQGSKAAASESKSFTRGSIVRATGSVVGSMSTPSGKCWKCGRAGHNQFQCRDKEVTCFNCNGKGHISTHCPKRPKPRATGSGSQAERPKAIGRVFALSGAEAARSESLIQGACFIAETPFIVLFDSGSTHSFISVSCVQKLDLPWCFYDRFGWIVDARRKASSLCF